MSTPLIGRNDQYYIKPSTGGYAGQPTFAATNAFRANDGIALDVNIRNRTDAKDRWTTPGVRRRTTHKTTAQWNLPATPLFASGTLGTVPEADVVLLNTLGAQTIGSASTTVSASPSPTTTTFTVDSPTGLAVGKLCAINVTGVGICVRMITGLVSSAVTIAPALPSAPTTADTVKTGVHYTLATELPSDFCIGAYNTTNGTSITRQLNGCVGDKLSFILNADDEIMFAASGPARDQTRPAQSIPGGYTTVGTVVPVGITGGLSLASAAYNFQKAQIDVTNGMKLRNSEYGQTKAVGYYRPDRRIIEVSLDCYVEDPTALYANAESTVTVPMLFQTGTTEGAIWALYLPAVEFEIPSTPSSENELVWSFKGVALDSAGNDALHVGQF